MSNYEKNLALRQGHGIASEDGYFEARPQIDSMDRRKVFGAGFERGWEAALAAEPAQERIQALELEVRQLTEQIAGLRHAPTPQADSQPAQVLVYPPLPEPFIGVQNQPWGGHAEVIRSAIGEDGVIPCFTADQMRAFADGTHALRTKSEASREFLERMLSAMEGVIDVADRKTAEFDALRSCVVDLTLMLFKPEALRASRGQAPAGMLNDAARLERERICAAIKAEDDYCVEHGDYMLDSDDCIKIARSEWVRPDYLVDAARKQGANHD